MTGADNWDNIIQYKLMHSSNNSDLVFHHITLFIWISWILVILSGALTATYFLGFQLGFILGLIALIFSLIYLFKNYLEHWTEYLVLENSCVTLNKGIIWKTKSQIPYYKINNIQITDFLWIHNLSLDTGNDTTNINFAAIQRPNEFKEIINERIEQERHFEATGKVVPSKELADEPMSQQYSNLERKSVAQFQNLSTSRSKSAYQQPSSFPTRLGIPQNQHLNSQMNIIDELERLNMLKQQGVLSSVEFEFAKKRVLMGK